VQVRSVKHVAALFVPEGLLLAATIVALRLDALARALPAFSHFYPYAVFVVGALLAWRFQRSRLLFALIVLALAGVGLAAPTGTAIGRATFQATAFLLPLNLAALALLADRGVITPVGLLRLGAIGLQVFLVTFIQREGPPTLIALLGQHLLPARWFAWTPLRQPALLAFTAAIVVTTLPLLFERNPTQRGFLWAIVAAFLAANARPSHATEAIYLGTAGLILVVAVIEASYLLAYQDGLTSLPARRALTEALERLGGGGHYTVAMIDVDHFKRFNDTYGHDVGDQVLRMVAAKLAQVTGGGRAYRYGGEEFAVLFPGKSLDDVLPHLEEVREAVADTNFTIRRRLRARKRGDAGSRPRRKAVITVSIGAAERNQRHSAPEQVLRAADQALYRAKEDGRNRVRT
jgi:diguanylate cyclase (GGDEF)-like protein